MERFRQHAKTAGAPDEKGLQAKEKSGGTDAEQSGALLFLNGLVKTTRQNHGIRLSAIRDYL
jgi:hypothetical protein